TPAPRERTLLSRTELVTSPESADHEPGEDDRAKNASERAVAPADLADGPGGEREAGDDGDRCSHAAGWPKDNARDGYDKEDRQWNVGCLNNSERSGVRVPEERTHTRAWHELFIST